MTSTDFARNRHDLSQYLVHFTTDRQPCCSEGDNPATTAGIAGTTAQARLISILQQKKVLATKMPWVNRNAVCFTECPWPSLVDHARAYSPFGVGFTKSHVFAAGGGPAFYVRADLYRKQTWDAHLHTFVTPFMPPYAPKTKIEEGLPGGKVIDYTHEREWRVPHDFRFELDQVAFVVVDSYNDVAAWPRDLKDAIGRERFLIMDVYRQIETLWPIHRV